MRALVLRGGPWSQNERVAHPRLLRERRVGAGAAAAGHAAAHRSAARLVARPLHGGGGGHGIRRRADRRRRRWHCLRRALDRHSGRSDRAPSTPTIGVFDGRTFKADRLRQLSRAHGHPVAAARKRPARSQRRHLPPDGEGLPDRVADARAAQRAVRSAAERSGRRAGRPQPHDPVRVPLAHRPQPAEQHQVHLRPERVAARADQAAARARRRLCRLVAARIRHRRRACPAIAAMQAAYLSGDPYLAFAKQAGAVPADATKATHGPTRELFKQCVLAVQYGMEADSLAYAHRAAADRGARPAAGASRDLSDSSGAGRTRPSTTPCSPARCTPCSAGTCTSARIPTRGRCAISRCRPTAPRCCGWPAAWRPSAASKSARRCTTRC